MTEFVITKLLQPSVYLPQDTLTTKTPSVNLDQEPNKQAINLLLRNDLNPIIFLGNLKLEFQTKEIRVNTLDGIQESQKVQVKISGKKDNTTINRVEDTGFVTDFGALDWKNLADAVREFVANAIDASLKIHNNAQKAKITLITDKPRATKDTTKVFIPVNDEIIKIFSELKKRFLQLNPEEKVIPILNKSNRGLKYEDGVSIYKKGVLVGEFNKKSIFDYNLDAVDLDESRNIKSSHLVESEVGNILGNSDVSTLAQVFTRIVQDENLFEAKISEYNFFGVYAQEKKDNWKKAFILAFGEDAVLTLGNMFDDSISKKGKTPVKFPEGWYRKACQFDVPNNVNMLTEDEKLKREIVPASILIKHKVETYFNLLKSRNLTYGKELPEVFEFNEPPKTEQCLGFARTNGVYFNRELTSNSGNSELLDQTIIEELAHYITDATDFSRIFQNFLTKICVVFMEGQIL